MPSRNGLDASRSFCEHSPNGAVVKACELCGGRYQDSVSRCPLDGSALKELRDPLVGRTIGGRYVLAQRIGAGGMGTVYRARHEVVGRDVAVKFLARHLSAEPSHRERFLREARAANRINHEHIIDITDCGETPDGLVYLVMEFLDGVPLNVELERAGALPLRRALSIGLQIASALGRAHELDVYHRDIKPENIYLLAGYDGDFVKILDFGLAQMRGELRLTATGTVFGTPEYMSPEQVRGAEITHLSDLYSLGVVLFEMLAGTKLFEGSTPELIMKHLRVPPRAPSHCRAGIPPEIDALVLRLLAKDPSERPHSAHQLAEDIKARLRGLGESVSDSVPSIRPEHRTIAPRATETGTGTLVLAWRERVEFFGELAARAHGHSPPYWLAQALWRLRERVEWMAAAREELRRRIAEAMQQEESARQSRLQIGRALDELSRDEGKAAAAIGAGEKKLLHARQVLDRSRTALPPAWRAIPPCPPSLRDPPEHVVDRLLAAGEIARAMREAASTIRMVAPELEMHRRQREDLSFQVAQLKGRLGSFNAATQLELDDLRSKTRELDEQIERELENVLGESATLVQHFMQFPELHDLVKLAGAS